MKYNENLSQVQCIACASILAALIILNAVMYSIAFIRRALP